MNSSMKVVIAEPITPKLSSLVEDNNAAWQVYNSSPRDKQELIARLKDADIASSYSVKYDEVIFKACPKLKYLAIPAVGANFFVDMDAANKYGVTVMNCPGYNSTAVAEMAIGLAISVGRMIPALQYDLQHGVWDESSNGQSQLLGGKNIGIIGQGNVGKALQGLLTSWNTTTSFINSSSSVEYVDKTIAACDILFICCPLTKKTQGLVSKTRIDSMKKTAYIVNVGRGAVVDEDALYDALKHKRIHGAGLDVFAEEPEYGNEVPQTIKRFIELDNVTVTPHLAGSSVESSETLGRMLYENILSVLSGSPANIYT